MDDAQCLDSFSAEYWASHRESHGLEFRNFVDEIVAHLFAKSRCRKKVRVKPTSTMSNITADKVMKNRSRFGRTAGIASGIITQVLKQSECASEDTLSHLLNSRCTVNCNYQTMRMLNWMR